MRIVRFISVVLFLATSVGTIWCVTGMASAQVQPKPGSQVKGGLTISPALQNVTIAEDQQEAVFDFSVTNNTAEAQELKLSLVDFGSLDETGGVLFVGEGKKALDHKYGLMSWATLADDHKLVAPHSTVRIPVTINNDETFGPGGHYGAIVVTPANKDSAVKVHINQVATGLIFVKKQGGEVFKLSLSSYELASSLYSLPNEAKLRFQNSGNVHVVPRGTITITDPSGKTVKRGVINSDSGIILPESFRKLTTPIDTIASSWVPGKYKATVSYRYDETSEFKTETTYFVYVNPVYISAVGLSLGLLISMLTIKKWRRLLLRPFRGRAFTNRTRNGRL